MPILILFFCLTTSSHAVDVTLGWSANPGSEEVIAYSIHYRAGSSGPPYSGTGADEGDSPIIVSIAELIDPESPQYTIHGLSDSETYFFALTATNDYGEGGYSDEACINCPSGANSDGGGGGG